MTPPDVESGEHWQRYSCESMTSRPSAKHPSLVPFPVQTLSLALQAEQSRHSVVSVIDPAEHVVAMYCPLLHV